MTHEAALPGILADIAELAGMAAAARVARERGGGRVYIPSPNHVGPGHWLAQAMGQEPARRLARQYCGLVVDIPLGPFAGHRNELHAAIRRALATGASVRDAAIALGVTERTVYNIKASRKKRGADQHNLPL